MPLRTFQNMKGQFEKSSKIQPLKSYNPFYRAISIRIFIKIDGSNTRIYEREGQRGRRGRGREIVGQKEREGAERGD